MIDIFTASLSTASHKFPAIHHNYLFWSRLISFIRIPTDIGENTGVVAATLWYVLLSLMKAEPFCNNFLFFYGKRHSLI